MTQRVLVTGGAGFIGRHVVHALIKKDYEVRVIDLLLDQVHKNSQHDPILDEIEFIHGDVRDAGLVARSLARVDRVIHLAAEVGVGQSMYAIDRYVSVNDLGTAVLFQKLSERPVERVVVASSMSIYGEGLYQSQDGTLHENVVRSAARPRGAGWNPLGADGQSLVPLPTPETKRPSLVSVYALTKYVQERLALTVADAYGMECVALRLFNVFGPGQALSNPYTGVLAIFASRFMKGRSPVVFEDGAQRRDFVHVEDVARAFVLALEKPAIGGGVFNIASGRSRSVLDVAKSLAKAMECDHIALQPSGKGRTGDVRHCFADTTLAREVLGFSARRDFDAGLDELVEWLRDQQVTDSGEQASRELAERGLVA